MPAPAPAAPAAPTAPVAPAASQAAPPAERPGISTMGNAFDDLDKMTADPSPPPPAKSAAPVKPDATVEDDVEVVPPAESKPATPPTEEKIPPKQLREAYASAKKRLAEMEAKLKDYESGPSAQEKGDLQKRLEEREKRLAEIEKELEYTAFEKSDRFKETYEKPYHRAWNLGRSWVSQLTVTDPSTGEERQGTKEDFDAVMQLSAQNPDQAAELMDQLFGSKASSVAPYMVKVNEAMQSIQEALAEVREKGASRDKERLDAQTKTQKETAAQIDMWWKKYTGEAAEKYPQWFKPVDGDDKGNEILQKGFEQAAKAFARLNPNDPNLTIAEREEVVAHHAALFNKAAAFPRLVYQLRQTDAKVKALEEELKQYKASEPGTGNGAGKASTTSAVPSWETDLEKRMTPLR